MPSCSIGTSTFTGGLSISGGRLALGNASAIGQPTQVVVTNSGQFSFGTATNANFTGGLTISTLGFTDSTITGSPPAGRGGQLLFTGTGNVWSGPVSR